MASRRKPGPTLPQLENLNGGSRLAPGAFSSSTAGPPWRRTFLTVARSAGNFSPRNWRPDMVMFLDEERIARLLSWEKLIPAMERALAEFSQGRVLQPVRQMLTIEEEKRYLGIMPAVAETAMGLKLVSFYPGNAGTDVPTHMAMVLLFRADTGEPLAVMDGRPTPRRCASR